MKIEGEEDELLAVLLSVVSIEQGLSQKALGEVATTLIDRVRLAGRIMLVPVTWQLSHEH